MIDRRWIGTSVAVLILAAGLASPNVIPPPGNLRTPDTSNLGVPGTGLVGHLPHDPIQHVITIMMENHAYDSYFATYCLALGPYCSSTGNGIPAGTCVPYYPTYPAAGCIVPFNMTPAQFTIPDMEHDQWSGRQAMDGGAMDGFYVAEGTTNTFGHYNQTTVPIYWDMAEEYASSDNFWSGNLSYSLPNHWYMVAGTVPPIAYNNYIGFSGLQPTYLGQANSTKTVEDLLNRSTLSWKYYDDQLPAYSTSIQGGAGWGTAYDYWNPMAARAESYNSSYVNHFVARGNFAHDLATGALPNVSWIIPDPAHSDHPGFNNSLGESWAATMVDLVENSTYWNSTAIFLSWDEYGGFYDHVAPPQYLSDVLGFRAPFLVISPYAKENYISHSVLDTMSLLRFVEWQFGLGCLTPLDCLAPLPLDLFDFNQTARAPILFPTTWTAASYPIPLQQAQPLELCPAACLSVGWPDANRTSAVPLAPIVDWS